MESPNNIVLQKCYPSISQNSHHSFWKQLLGTSLEQNLHSFRMCIFLLQSIGMELRKYKKKKTSRPSMPASNIVFHYQIHWCTSSTCFSSLGSTTLHANCTIYKYKQVRNQTPNQNMRNMSLDSICILNQVLV